MAFTVATFVAFTILVAVLSWWKTRDDDLSTKEGYFLAGRGLPGIVIAGSLMMTNLSAEQLVGTNGQAFAGNMSTMAWEATSAFALIVLAFVFLPKLLRGGIATIPEFFEMRYDTFTMRLFSLLFLIAYVVTMLPTILYSGAVALVKIFDLESMFGISYFSAITLICIGTGIMNFINECWGFFSMPLLTAVLFGLLSKKAPAIAPKIVIPVHIVLYGLTKVIPFFSRFHYLYVVFALFVLECIIYAICIKVSPRQLAWEMPDAKVMDMTPWKNGKVWAIAGAAVVAIMYLIFSPLGIGA